MYTLLCGVIQKESSPSMVPLQLAVWIIWSQPIMISGDRWWYCTTSILLWNVYRKSACVVLVTCLGGISALLGLFSVRPPPERHEKPITLFGVDRLDGSDLETDRTGFYSELGFDLQRSRVSEARRDTERRASAKPADVIWEPLTQRHVPGAGECYLRSQQLGLFASVNSETACLN